MGIKNTREQSVSATSIVLASALGIFALALLGVSLGWEYTRDTPLLNYVGFVIWDHGFAPYRDIFETSMPGTLAFHSLVAGTGLASNTGFMLLAAVIVLGFSLLGALMILPLGRAGALVACPLLVCAILLQGPGWILKIDMVALLPISAAFTLAIWRRPRSIATRQVLIGALFGVAGTMKPHLMLGAPVAVLLAYLLEHWSGRWRDLPIGLMMKEIALSLAGFAVPMLLVVFWLVSSGAWPSFVFVLTEYLPLHLEKTDWQEFVTPAEKQRISRGAALRFGGYYPLAIAAALAAALGVFWRHRLGLRERAILIALCLLTVFYGLSPWVGGQFYVYYYFPFFFFSLLLIAAGITLIDAGPLPKPLKTVSILGVGGFLVVFGSQFYEDRLFRQTHSDQVVRMQEALTTWVPDGGRVQPIDWTSGVVHAMLREEILPATAYLYDYHFHHHVGGAINTGLRDSFIATLEADPPEVILQALEFPRVTGLNTSETFPARDAFVAEQYRQVAQEDGFIVYLRNDLAGP